VIKMKGESFGHEKNQAYTTPVKDFVNILAHGDVSQKMVFDSMRKDFPNGSSHSGFNYDELANYLTALAILSRRGKEKIGSEGNGGTLSTAWPSYLNGYFDEKEDRHPFIETSLLDSPEEVDAIDRRLAEAGKEKKRIFVGFVGIYRPGDVELVRSMIAKHRVTARLFGIDSRLYGNIRPVMGRNYIVAEPDDLKNIVEIPDKHDSEGSVKVYGIPNGIFDILVGTYTPAHAAEGVELERMIRELGRLKKKDNHVIFNDLSHHNVHAGKNGQGVHAHGPVHG
jgi:hypothetical protein